MRAHLVEWLDRFLPHNIASLLAPSWFTCVGLAGLVTLLVLIFVARRRGIDAGVIASAALWAYVAAVAAGIVIPMMIDAVQQLFTTGRVHLRWSGMTSFWGYLAGFVAVAVVCRKHRLPLARFGDLVAAPLGIALVFARLGCFLGGCDYGKVTSVPWAIRFPSGSPAWRDHVRTGLVPADRAESLAVHPTQLYEALLGLVIVGVAVWAARRRWARDTDGRVFLATAATYAVGRIVIEIFRADLGRGIYFGLSSGQIFSIIVLVAISAGLLVARRRAVMAIAAAALAMVVIDPHAAMAQPAPPVPQPAGPPPAQQPVAAPQPQPAAPPHAPPAYGPAAAPAPAVPPPAPAGSSTAPPAPDTARTPYGVAVGALFGLAMPINRRPEQVATLGGPSISIGWTGERAGVWLDFDSLGNTDASHGTLLLSGSFSAPVTGKLRLGARVGVGATLVNFDEPAFRDILGTALRAEAIAEYPVTDSWVAWIRPMSIDTLIAADLGGPITTWQMRIGFAYRFGLPRKSSQPAPAPARTPGPPAAPAPYPYPPPNPYPSPTPYPAPSPYPPPNPYPAPSPYPPPNPYPAPTPNPQNPYPPAPAPSPAPAPAPRSP